jgi:Kunitz/Bovine pancreatic trypsin inhibitor domain
VCEQPVEPGPCLGNYTRWAYNEETGECDAFAYGGCHGNRNRFVTREACQAACRHKRLTLETARRCKQPTRTAIELTPGRSSDAAGIAATVAEQCAAVDSTTITAVVPGDNPAVALQALWAFDAKSRRCRPFYTIDCASSNSSSGISIENDSSISAGNQFLTVEACEAACPAAFPPELEVAAKVLNMEEGTETVLEIRAEGHPFPRISWLHNNNPVELPSERMQLRADK